LQLKPGSRKKTSPTVEGVVGLVTEEALKIKSSLPLLGAVRQAE
jgi:hypothetical protein